MSAASVLRARIERPGRPLLLPGAPNALTARVLEEAGAEAVYVSGAGVSNTFLGSPDVGLLTMPEIAAHVAAIRDAVDLPLVVDADTGFGNAVNVQRTMRTFERAGAAAVQLEDQVMPKRCGHFEGKSVISCTEMVGKVRAALDARDQALVIARTDALAVSGIDEACDRANAYLEAGADVAFVEAVVTREQMRTVLERVPGRHVVNIVEGGKTPTLPLAELGELGFSVVLYANTAMRAAIAGMRRVAATLLADGDSLGVVDDIASWADRQSLVRKPEFDRLDEFYAGSRP